MRSSWQSVFEDLQSRWIPAGLDLAQPFQVAWYNRAVDDAFRLPDFGRSSALGILVGNTSAIWPRFLDAVRANAPVLDERHPLESYVEATVLPSLKPLIPRSDFDGERGRTVAVKERHPLAQCAFSDRGLSVRIAAASLEPDRLSGRAHAAGHTVGWQLQYTSPQPPLLLLSERLYDGGFPKAKSLVGSPGALYSGSLEVDGETIPVDAWQGSQNHNWGERHTDRYAWGQVAGFDGEQDAFLECASARMRFGPLWTPWITPLVLRLDGREHRLNALTTALRADARVSALDWHFSTAGAGTRVSGRISAPCSAFVGLTYDDPTGRSKVCLNTKIASCELQVDLPGQASRRLSTQARAAFELLTDGETHGVTVAL